MYRIQDWTVNRSSAHVTPNESAQFEDPASTIDVELRANELIITSRARRVGIDNITTIAQKAFPTDSSDTFVQLT